MDYRFIRRIIRGGIKMKCNKSCCHYPCTRKECGENKKCKEYKSIVQEAIDFIEQVNKEE